MDGGARSEGSAARSAAARRGLRLVYATIVWNAFEGAAAILVGIAAHSVALTAYGLDSSLEVFVSGVAAWQLTTGGTARDRPALRAVGICYLIVALYVGVQSVLHLLSGARPEATPLGIALTAAAVAVMTVLGILKARVARSIANRVLAAEARFSLVDAALSATVLLGLAANAAAGWWWADPGVALLLAALALREGVGEIRSSAGEEGTRTPPT
jgi:divalent metal cation (Fe/Co/Zn/Cd) transporter